MVKKDRPLTSTETSFFFCDLKIITAFSWDLETFLNSIFVNNSCLDVEPAVLWALKRASQAYSTWEAVSRLLYLQLDTVRTEPWLWTSLHSSLPVLFCGALRIILKTLISQLPRVSSTHLLELLRQSAGLFFHLLLVCPLCEGSWPLRVREWTLLTPTPSLVRFPVRAASWICFMFSWTSALVCCSRSAWPWNRKWRQWRRCKMTKIGLPIFFYFFF